MLAFSSLEKDSVRKKKMAFLTTQNVWTLDLDMHNGLHVPRNPLSVDWAGPLRVDPQFCFFGTEGSSMIQLPLHLVAEKFHDVL